MSIFDGQKLPSSTFKLDTERLPTGWYSDTYFLNITAPLGRGVGFLLTTQRARHTIAGLIAPWSRGSSVYRL